MNRARFAAGISLLSIAACDPFATPGDSCIDCDPYSRDPYVHVAIVEAFPRVGYEDSQKRVVLGGQLAKEDSLSYRPLRGGLPFRWGYVSTYEGYTQYGRGAGDTLYEYETIRFHESVPKAAVGMAFSIPMDRSDSRLRSLGMAEDNAAPPECGSGLFLSSPMDEEHRRVELVFGTKIACASFLDLLTNTASSTRMTLHFAFMSSPPIQRISVEGVDVLAPPPGKP